MLEHQWPLHPVLLVPFHGKDKTVPMSSSVYSISNSWLISHNIVTNILLKSAYFCYIIIRTNLGLI